jgi:tRNA-splicing ligase RtcB
VIEIWPRIKQWTEGVEVEHEATRQLINVASLYFVGPHIAVMPDVHWGIGATVGSVIPTKGAIIPAAVGVDIGCGMIWNQFDLDANDIPMRRLSELRAKLEEAVPHGWGKWEGSSYPKLVNEHWKALKDGHKRIIDQHPSVDGKNDINQLGTMGGGNHFLEVVIDESNKVGLMIHSGSRGIGNRIGKYFIEKAREEMREHLANLPDKDLAYLNEGTESFDDYVFAVGWAQDFARRNREIMMDAAIRVLAEYVGRPLLTVQNAANCHHNYVQKETHFDEELWITRKGAVNADEGRLGIIPGSMGARSYIVEGKGNSDSFRSCSHGAGRRMSRGKAKKQISIQEHELATEGIECRKDAGVIDESPGAYKSIDAVMAAQADLVDVVHELRQIVCVKG